MSFKRFYIGLLAPALALFAMVPSLAADLPARYAAPAPVAYYAAPVFSWAGSYIGASAGYAFKGSNENAHLNVNTFGGPGGTYGSDLDGYTYGAYAGYNFQVGSLVIGPEFGLSGGNLRGSDNYPQYFNNTGTKIDWYGAAAVRLGFAVDRALFFVKGGYAGGNVAISQSYFPLSGVGASFANSQYRSGYVLGAGVDFAMTTNIVLRGEYEYVSFGSKAYSGVDSNGHITQISNKADAHLAKLGVAYKF